MSSSRSNLPPIRVYADTSVFGGAFDPEFQEATRVFFDQVRHGTFILVISAVARRELQKAPTRVQSLYRELLPLAEALEIGEAALRLADAYLAAEIVSPKSADDALHVALATVARCPVIVSWNFRHIVHFQKIALYNKVNVAHGHRTLGIFSPREVIEYED